MENIEKKSYHPMMHSAEHILNQTMVQMFNKGRSFSAHIERKKSKCDYKNFDRNLTEEERVDLQTRINNVIKLNLPVEETFITRADATLKFNLERLPESAGDKIRVIKIGDYDSCPCIGEHVANTSEIGSVRIISSSFEKEKLRIRFKLD